MREWAFELADEAQRLRVALDAERAAHAEIARHAEALASALEFAACDACGDLCVESNEKCRAVHHAQAAAALRAYRERGSK